MRGNLLCWCCWGLGVAMLGWASQATAADSETADPDAMPYYQNAAQAAHDANLAEAFYQQIDAESRHIQDELEQLDPDGDGVGPDEKSTRRIGELTAQLDTLAAQRGLVEEGSIARMREAGMGWGEIAHELGVHPGALGLGHQRQGTDSIDEMALATATDRQTGNSSGHGNAYGQMGGTGDKGNGPGGKHGGQDKSGKSNNGGKGNGGGKKD